MGGPQHTTTWGRAALVIAWKRTRGNAPKVHTTVCREARFRSTQRSHMGVCGPIAGFCHSARVVIRLRATDSSARRRISRYLPYPAVTGRITAGTGSRPSIQLSTHPNLTEYHHIPNLLGRSCNPSDTVLKKCNLWNIGLARSIF